MSDRTIVLWTIAAFASATPVAAQAPAPTTTAFDGTYVGVSQTVEGAMFGDDHPNRRQMCAKNSQPGPLTIAGGVARWPGTVPTAGGTAEGSVNAQGVLVMHGPLGMRFDGQINGRGMVTGRLTSFCGYHIVWQKEAK
jgi:hypothetical protein